MLLIFFYISHIMVVNLLVDIESHRVDVSSACQNRSLFVFLLYFATIQMHTTNLKQKQPDTHTSFTVTAHIYIY